MNITDALDIFRQNVPGTLLTQVDAAPLPSLSFQLTNPEEIMAICQHAKLPLALYQVMRLDKAAMSFSQNNEKDTDLEPLPTAESLDLSDHPAFGPFMDRLGEPMMLSFFVPYQGQTIVSDVVADWWDDFWAAAETAKADWESQQHHLAEQKRATFATRARQRRELLEQKLPHHPDFIRLAKEYRPRITAMRLVAGEILEKIGENVTWQEDETIRRIAADIKEEAKKK